MSRISDSLAVPHAKMHASNVLYTKYIACAVNFEKHICPAENVLLVGWGLGFQKLSVWAAVFGRPNPNTRPLGVIWLTDLQVVHFLGRH
jgi:hypothetical protein